VLQVLQDLKELLELPALKDHRVLQELQAQPVLVLQEEAITVLQE
jgi:hypothetical protein